MADTSVPCRLNEESLHIFISFKAQPTVAAIAALAHASRNTQEYILVSHTHTQSFTYDCSESRLYKLDNSAHCSPSPPL